MFQFFLNGTQITDQPEGWDGMTSSIKRDDLTGGLIFDADIKFKSYGGQDLYVALKTAWDADKFGTSTMDIFQRSGTAGNVLIHAGTIFHSDLKWKLINNAVEFKVDDASFYSKIKANKSVESNVDVTLSKNLVPITAPTFFQLECHKVSNGTYYAQKRYAYKLYDVIKYYIDFMSDGTIGFESDCFGVGGVYEGYCIVGGDELYSHAHLVTPRMSFQKLFEDLRKRFNVRFSMVGSITSPIMKLEPNAFWFESADVYTIPEPPDEVVMNVNQSLLYANVKVGSEKYETTSAMTFPDVQSLVAFREETFHFEGTNNVDNTLDLVGSLVISNSSIDLCLEKLSGYESYNEDVFLIHYDTVTNRTISSDWLGLGHHFYNETLNNVNILNRWSDSLPNNIIANFANTNDNRFEAVMTNTAVQPSVILVSNTGPTLGGPLRFDDDYTLGNDPGGNYGATTAQGSPVSQANSIYTASANGRYTFTSEVLLSYSGSPNLSTQVEVYFQKFDSSNSQIDDFYAGRIFMASSGNHIVSGTWITYMLSTEYIAVYLNFISTGPAGIYSYQVRPFQTKFRCDAINLGGGVLSAVNSEAYKCVKMDFKYPMTLSDYQSIRASKSGIIEVPLLENKSIRGWIENVKFDHYGGETSFSLITDGNTIYR